MMIGLGKNSTRLVGSPRSRLTCRNVSLSAARCSRSIHEVGGDVFCASRFPFPNRDRKHIPAPCCGQGIMDNSVIHRPEGMLCLLRLEHDQLPNPRRIFDRSVVKSAPFTRAINHRGFSKARLVIRQDDSGRNSKIKSAIQGQQIGPTRGRADQELDIVTQQFAFNETADAGDIVKRELAASGLNGVYPTTGERRNGTVTDHEATP
jgi:hypothetical protein